MRASRRALAAALLASIALVLLAAPASAHAQLVSTDPAAGAQLVCPLWPDGAEDRLVRRVLTVAAVTGAAASAVSMGLEGADIAGFGVGQAISLGRAADTFDTSFGKAAVVRVVLFLAAVVF